MSLGWNSKPECTDTEDGKRLESSYGTFLTIFVALISCALAAPDFALYAKTVSLSKEAGQ